MMRLGCTSTVEASNSIGFHFIHILTSRAMEHFRKSFQKNLDVQAQAPVLDVIEIKRHARLKGWIAPRSYLPQTSKTRFDIQPTKVFRRVPLKIIHRVWPWTHQTHVPNQHVYKLRQLIDAKLAEPLPAACDSWISFHLEKRALSVVYAAEIFFVGVSVFYHGSKLVTGKFPSLLPDSSSGINGRSERVQANP